MAPEVKQSVQPSLGLPVLIASPVDVGRLIRELETLDDSLQQAAIRGSEVKLTKTSHLLDQTVTLNKLNLLAAADRQHLLQFLGQVRDSSPVLHISFSADPSVAFIEKLMAWLRKEIHPQLLLTIGLQPTIGAGCIVRSTNKHFDFSLRQDFLKKRDLLLSKLVAEPSATPPLAAAPVAAAPVATVPAPVAQGVAA